MTMTHDQARAAAAHWISPADPELTRFATGHSEPDWADFLAEIEKCRPYADANGPDAERDHAELDALAAYAEMQILLED